MTWGWKQVANEKTFKPWQLREKEFSYVPYLYRVAHTPFKQLVQYRICLSCWWEECAQTYIYALTSRFPKICHNFSKLLMSIPQFSILSFWLAYLPQLLFAISGRHNVKQLPLIILTNACGEKAMCAEWAAIRSCSFSKLAQTWGGRMEIGQLKISQNSLFLPISAIFL